jgi:hypothetical protein
MVKRIISTVVLILIGLASFSVGLISCQTSKKPQTEQTRDKNTEADFTLIQGSSAIVKHGNIVKHGRDIASVLIPDLKAEKGLQKALIEKSNHILSVWEYLKVTKGVGSILLAAQATGTEALSPADDIMGKLSNLLSWAFSLMLFWKILLTLSGYMIFLAVIPICVIIIIVLLWTYKDRKKVPKLIITTALISLLITFTVPLALYLSSVLDTKLLADNIETLTASIDEKGKLAENMDRNVSAARRQSASIVSYIGNSKNLSNGMIEDVINYYMIFLFVYFFIPVVLIILIIFLARHFIKLILAG